MASDVAALEARIEELERRLSAVQANLRAVRSEQLAGYLSTLTIAGVLTLGVRGGLWQGPGTFAAPITGIKMWNDGGIFRIAGYNGGVIQWEAAVDGKIKAGAGKVTLSSDGILLDAGAMATGTSELAWKETAGEFAWLAGNSDGNTARELRATIQNAPGKSGDPQMVWAVIGDTGEIDLAVQAVSYGGAPAIYIFRVVGPQVIEGNAVLGTTGFLMVRDLDSTPVADAGIIRLPNEQWVAARNGADTANCKIFRVSSDDGLIIGTLAQAADAELENSQFCIWYDEAATMVNIKVKDSAGVVRTAQILAV